MIESVRDHFMSFFRDAAEYIRAHPEKVPLYSDEKWQVRTENGKQLGGCEVIAKRQYGWFVRRPKNTVSAFPSFQALITVIQSSDSLMHAFRLAGDRSEWAKDFLEAYVAPLAQRIFAELDSGGEFESIVGQALEGLDAFIQKDEFRGKFIAPLLKFTCASDNLELMDGHRVCKLTERELELCLNTAGIPERSLDTFKFFPAQIEFQLEKIVSEPRTSAKPPHFMNAAPIQQSFEKVLKALRLIKPGAIGYALFQNRRIGFLGPEEGGMTSFPASWQEHTFGEKYVLTASDLPPLRTIFAQLDSLESIPKFSLAMRRFMDAYHKLNEVDRLIDYWIGLESLLLPDGQGELRFKAALRAAYLVGHDAERLDIFKQTLQSYDKRSDVVHGSPKPANPELVKKTEDLLRRALRRCLELEKVPDGEFLNHLILGHGPVTAD